MTVHGAGFSSASESLAVLTCRIGGTVRRAVWASSSAIVCNATRAPVGESRIEVSNNAREYTSSGVRVRLVSVRIVDVQPWSGPVGGATVVSVRSYGVWPGGVRCRFGDSSLSVGWSGGASRLRCLTPASGGDASGWVGVQLSSFHGALSSGGSFYYHASLTASATAPSLGPERGGTRVSLLGGGFRDAYTLRCLTPASGGDASGWVGVQLSSFHGALSSGGSFYYHPSLTASGATPSIGPERGGTRVSLLGGGFRDAYTLRCAFGSVTAPVLARYVDESQLECSSPVHAPGIVDVLLSMNGQQYARSGASYTYQPAASVSYISPTSVLSEGGTPLTVHGVGFSSASESLGLLTCRIGSTVRRAVWASSSAIVCNATRAPVGESRIEVSNNAREYTSSGVRVRLVSVRIVDVQPWSGPVGGATVVSVRSYGCLLYTSPSPRD